jgi:hypothetical protein
MGHGFLLAPAATLLLLAGCATPSACDRVPATLTVEGITGSDLLVADGSLVLHAAASSIHIADASGCRAAAVSDLRVGDRVGHDATEIAESYPAQAWPKTVVAHR